MVILVDAYNLLKYLYGALVNERHKEQLIALLNRYVRRKSHTVYLVFDGGDSTRPMQYKKGLITIVYAGYGKSADDVLIDMMKQNWAFDGLLVSNDRALRSHATPFSIDSIGVKLFYDIISERTHPVVSKPTDPGIKKYDTTASDATLDDLLMADTNSMIGKDEIQDDEGYMSSGMPKDQKRYLVKLKRL